MKKILIISSVILLIGSVWAVSFMKVKPTDEFLYEAGFRNIPTLTGSSDAVYWTEHYHLKFFSFADMDALCKANGFIIGTSDRYTGVVPGKAAKEIQSNYERVKSDLPRYEVHDLTAAHNLIARFKLADLKGKARRHLPAFDSHNWGLQGQERSLDWFIKPAAIKNKLLSKDMINFSIQKNYEFERIYVIGHLSKFHTEGMNIGAELAAIPFTPERRDPLAVVKTETGWVVLAAWE